MRETKRFDGNDDDVNRHSPETKGQTVDVEISLHMNITPSNDKIFT